MSVPLVVVGASGFGRQTLDVVAAINAAASSQQYGVVGVLDDAPTEVNLARLAQRGERYLGTVDEFAAASEPQNYVVAIGSPSVRRRIVDKLDARGWNAVSLVHPSAVVGTLQDWGEGAVVCGGTHFSPNVTLGRHVHVNPNSAVGHDALVGDFVSFNLASSVSGNVTIEDEVLVGGGAFVLQDLVLGEKAVVGAGAVVTRDVPPDTTVIGVPARPSRSDD